jgi:hypothetical protein
MCARAVAATIVPTQQRAIVVAADQVRALHPVVARANGRRQIVEHVGGELVAVREKCGSVGRRKIGEQLPAAVAHAVGVHEEDELGRFQAHGNLRRNLFDRQVEDLARWGIADRRDQHDIAVVEPLLDCFSVDAAHFAGQLHVDAIHDAHRFCRQVVAA